MGARAATDAALVGKARAMTQQRLDLAVPMPWSDLSRSERIDWLGLAHLDIRSAEVPWERLSSAEQRSLRLSLSMARDLTQGIANAFTI